MKNIACKDTRCRGKRLDKMVRIITVFLYVLVLWGCGTGARQNKDADFYYKMGLSAFDEGNIQNAFVQFQTAMQMDPYNKDVLNSLGLVYIQLEDYNRAAELFLRAVDRDEGFSDSYNNLGVAYIKMKQWDKAIKALQRALGNPLFQNADKSFFNMGLCYYKAGQYKKAVEAFRDGSLRNPQVPLPYYWLALSYNRSGLYGEASAALAKGLKLDPAYAGDKSKFEEDIRRKLPLSEGLEERDYLDYLDILRY